MKHKKYIYGVIESIVLCLVVFYFFFYRNPLKEEYLSMNLHPLLIIVVAISLRYGNYIGLVSALIASIAYVYPYYLLDRDLYLFIIDFRYYKFLLMFFLAAVIFGRFKDNYDFKLQTAKMEYDKLMKNYEDLKSGYDKLKFIKEELRKRIVGAEYSIVSLYEIASSLETLDSEEIYTGIMDILSKFLKAKSVSIYTVNDAEEYLRLKLNMGQNYSVPVSIKVDEHICFKKVIKSKKTMKITSYCSNYKSYGYCPLLIGPIVKDEKVIAIVNINKMEFEKVTDYSFNLFKVIIDWITKALVQALEVEKINKASRFYKGTNIMKYDYFLKRLKEEKERKRKFGQEYCLLKYKIDDIDIDEIHFLFHRKIRRVDVLSYNEDEKTLYVLLPATEENKSEIVGERLQKIVSGKLERI